MPDRRRTPQPAAPRPLRVGTHNVRGLLSPGSGAPTRLVALLRCWAQERLDVVCLQETHVSAAQVSTARMQLALASRQLHLGCWVSWWSPAATPASGGVAILVRGALLTSGAFSFPGDGVLPAVAADGRVLHLPVRWGGHAFQLLSAYLPSSNPGGQRALIQGALAAAAALPGDHLWAADFNFVPAAGLDRASGRPQSGETVTAALFDAACPGLVDVFRALHPQHRAYSYLHTSGASRIDRVLASSALAPSVLSCTFGAAGPSDHRLVVVALAPLPAAPVPGPGLPRVRLHFLDHADLVSAFDDWLAVTVAAAPAAPAPLLDWWPAFKRSLAASAAVLNRLARVRQLAASQAEAAAQAAADAALAALAPGDAAALRAAVTARCAAAAAGLRAAAGPARRTRHAWLRTGERPCPVITQLLRPPASGRLLPALQRPDGSLATAPREMADTMAAFWRSVSAAAASAPAARDRVLGALRDAGVRCPPGAPEALGSLVVTATEVLAALRASPPGRAPGGDGIPVELFQRFAARLAGVLAAVYTAAADCGRLPAGFLDGVISSLHKTGPVTVPANFRPLTLLDTDYRTLARVLARRLAPVFADTIDPDQTAFLPLRRIADTVLLLQLYPELVRSCRRTGVAAFLDFHKAYDTLDRTFLYECLAALGVGPGFLTWVRLLLDGTRVAALVNGHLSGWGPLVAGVRQGCPLAPLLYLGPAQALLSWLKRQAFSLDLASLRPAASQYADDCTALLGGTAEVPRFLAAMEVFRGASGQRLNPGKVELLGVGALPVGSARAAPPPAPLPTPGGEVAGLRVVAVARTLGVSFWDLPAAGPAPPAPLERVYSALGQIAALPLSAFGRAFAASGYALSRVLYHLEFGGLPAAAALQQLHRTVAALVDRAQSPAAYQAAPLARLPGVPAACLPVPPVLGGFGLLPLEAHVRARHAVLAVRCVAGALPGVLRRPPPWAAVALAVLRAVHPAAHPLCLLASVQRGPSVLVLGRALPATCPALTRLVRALGALPPLVLVNPAPLLPGPWCFGLPLWGNPLLPAADPAAGGLEADFPALSELPGLSTVGRLLRCHHALRRVRAFLGRFAADVALSPRILRQCSRWYRDDVLRGLLRLPHPAALPAPLQSGAGVLRAVDALLARIPGPWLAAARLVLASPAAVAAVPPLLEICGRLASCLGWRAGATPVPLLALSVKAATLLQLSPSLDAVAARHTAFLSDALGVPDPPAAALLAFRAALRRLWQLRWENRHKEAFWRLALDGFAGFTMHAAIRARGGVVARCPCGAVMATGDRRHHFWDCPVAVCLRDVVAECLGAHGGLACRHLWLALPPPAVSPPVWDVVCLAAVAALERGRQLLFPRRVAGEAVVGFAVCCRVSAAVVSDFWSRLAAFAAWGRPPRGWTSVPVVHPFLSRSPTGGVRFSGPPDTASPPASP